MAEDITPNKLTIDEALEHVGDDPKTAFRFYRQEREGKNRGKLLTGLKDVIVDSMTQPGWAKKRATSNKGARFQIARANYDLFTETEAWTAYNMEQVFEQGDHTAARVRIDLDDEKTLNTIADALDAAADEWVDDSQTVFKTFARAARIARQQAEAAASFVQRREADEKENKRLRNKAAEDVSADAEQDADDIVNETVDA